MKFIDLLGRFVFNFLLATGRFGLFTAQTIRYMFTPPFYYKQLLTQLIEIGFYSLPVVALTTLFAGMVIALQTYTGFSQFSSEGPVSLVV